MEGADWQPIFAEEDVRVLWRQKKRSRQMVESQLRQEVGGRDPNWVFVGNACRVLGDMGSVASRPVVLDVLKRPDIAEHELVFSAACLALADFPPGASDSASLVGAFLDHEARFIREVATVCLWKLATRWNSKVAVELLEKYEQKHPGNWEGTDHDGG
jgi:hypothetical protein